MTEDQIKWMVDRFLTWNLPADFTPDGGINFEKYGNWWDETGTRHQYRHRPSGTNLLDASQATEMVRNMIDGLPSDGAYQLGYEAAREQAEATLQARIGEQADNPQFTRGKWWDQAMREAAETVRSMQPQDPSNAGP